jgi:peptidoglycan/xylan/chitin deacetylase (PgdA/CDA1 family)
VTFLVYHAVDPRWSSPLSVSPAAFAKHGRWLERNRAVLPLDEAIARMDRHDRLPRGMVAITFDDGYDSVFDHAFLVLRRLGLPFTVFLVAATLTDGTSPDTWVDGGPGHPLRTLSLEQVREMQRAGGRFGSHSLAHRDLTAMSEEESERDLRESREILEDLLQTPIRHLAYPGGLHSERVRRAARRAGFDHAFTTSRDLKRAGGNMAVPRIGVYPGNGTLTLRAKSSSWYIAVRRSRTFPLLRRVIVRGRAGRPAPPV